MASSSHFFLQISARSMQNGGGEGGFLHKSALGLQLAQKFSPGSGNPGCASRPLPTPPLHARPDQQHIPLVARQAETRAKRLRRREAKGPRASEASGRASRVEQRAEAGKTRPSPAGRAESAPRAGPRAGGWRVGGRMSKGEEAPRRS